MDDRCGNGSAEDGSTLTEISLLFSKMGVTIRIRAIPTWTLDWFRELGAYSNCIRSEP